MGKIKETLVSIPFIYLFIIILVSVLNRIVKKD